MLRVNLKKIDISDFAKKYGLVFYGKNEEQGEMYRTPFNPYVYFSEYERVNFFYEHYHGDNDRFFDLIFDMISNGDLIKEDEKEE